MRGLTNFMGRFTTIAAVAGVVSYFWKFDSYLTVLYCCAGLCFLHSVLNVAFGDQNNLVTEGYTLVIGAVVAFVFKLPLLSMLALFICFGELVFTVFALLSFLRFIIRIKQ